MALVENISDKNGRALEYCIVDHLSKQWLWQVDKATIEDQVRDKLKFDSLNEYLKERYQKAAVSVASWLDENYNVSKSRERVLRRLKDNESKKGDVSDISLSVDTRAINLSIKHNHSAIKHQRPGALPLQLGYDKASDVYKRYKVLYGLETTKFENAAKQFMPKATLFNELKNADNDYINHNLYLPICTLVSEFIEKYGQGSHSEFLFRFLVGSINYYKIIVYSEHIDIIEFAEIELPTSVKSYVNGNSYVMLAFSNGWEISMRLHTASSRITGVSLKFDTQPSNIDVPRAQLRY